MKIAIFSTIFFLLGWAVTYWVVAPGPHGDVDEAELVSREVQEKVYLFDHVKTSAQNLINKEFTDYRSTRDPKERYTKGQQLLEKVFKLFLANLSLKMDASDKAWLQLQTQKQNAIEDICAPSESGPDVYYNGLSDDSDPDNKSQIEDQLISCQNKLKGTLLDKSNELKTKKERDDWFGFTQKVFGNRLPRRVFPHDIFSELWTETPYSGDLKQFTKDYTRSYIGKFHGYYRTNTKNDSTIELMVKHTTNSQDGSVELRVKFRSSIGLYLIDKFETKHPRSHGGGGNGSCRGMVLKNNDDLVMHFIKVPGKKTKGFFGRIYDKSIRESQLVGSFYVVPKSQKIKTINWGKDRGYW